MTEKPALASWLPSMMALAVVWGFSFVFIEVAIGQLHPAYVTLGRVAAGALTLLVLLALTRQRLPRSGAMWGHLFVIGFLNGTAPFTLFGYGEQRVSSLLAGIWNGTTPLLVLPFAALVFRTERFTATKVTGLVTGFVGVLVVLGAWEGVGGSTLTGQLMCLAAAAFYGVAIPYQHKFVAPARESGTAIAAGMLLMATAQMLVVAPLLAGGAPPALGTLKPEVLGSVLALGALGTGIALAMNMRHIRIVGGSTASMVTYMIPVVAVVAGVLVLDEHLAWYQPAGAVIVLLGVAIAQGRFRRRVPVVAVPANPVIATAPD